MEKKWIPLPLGAQNQLQGRLSKTAMQIHALGCAHVLVGPPRSFLQMAYGFIGALEELCYFRPTSWTGRVTLAVGLRRADSDLMQPLVRVAWQGSFDSVCLTRVDERHAVMQLSYRLILCSACTVHSQEPTRPRAKRASRSPSFLRLLPLLHRRLSLRRSRDFSASLLSLTRNEVRLVPAWSN